MLKIKDNVDLKELEKYGYNNKYSKSGHYEKVIGYARTLWIEQDSSIWLEESMSYIDDEKVLEPLLYDLIKDGLVEKIEE
jgi:hypothetical protein